MQRQGPSDDSARVPRRVLVVEDNLDSVRTLVMVLRLEGYDVEFAINGYAAQDIAKRFQPHVVLLDLGLPGLNGLEVCKWLKRQPALEKTRVIALTAYGTDEDRGKSRAAGCDDHITKPYEVPQLLAAVRGQ